jgi:hypothetical protein
MPSSRYGALGEEARIVVAGEVRQIFKYPLLLQKLKFYKRYSWKQAV